MRKVVIYTLLSFIFGSVRAETITFNISSPIVSPHKEFSVSTKSDDLLKNKYRVRPIFEDGVIYIKNELGGWVNANEKWLDLPVFAKGLTFKIPALDKPFYNFSLDFQNIDTGSIYKSSFIPLINAEYAQRTAEVLTNNSKSEQLSGVPVNTEDISEIPKWNSRFVNTFFVVTLGMALTCVYSIYKAQIPI